MRSRSTSRLVNVLSHQHSKSSGLLDKRSLPPTLSIGISPRVIAADQSENTSNISTSPQVHFDKACPVAMLIARQTNSPQKTSKFLISRPSNLKTASSA